MLKPAGGSWGQLWGITLLDLKTHRSRILYRYPSENGIVSLTWSPDGSQLVATVEYGGGYGSFRLAVPSGKLLKSYRLNASSASWHPQARRAPRQVVPELSREAPSGPSSAGPTGR